MKNVVIVDDQKLFLEAMRDMFSGHPEFRCLGIAHGEKELLSMLKGCDVDVVLLDVEIPATLGKDGIEIARLIKTSSEYNQIKVISMSVNTQSYVLRKLLQEVGVDGFIDKTSCGKEVVFDALKTVLSGAIYASPVLMEKAKRILKIETLSEREKQILKWIILGKTNTEIAESLFIARKTVDNHRQNIYKKMKCKSTAELASQYYRFAFLHNDDGDLPNFKGTI